MQAPIRIRLEMGARSDDWPAANAGTTPGPPFIFPSRDLSGTITPVVPNWIEKTIRGSLPESSSALVRQPNDAGDIAHD